MLIQLCVCVFNYHCCVPVGIKVQSGFGPSITVMYVIKKKETNRNNLQSSVFWGWEGVLLCGVE